MTYFSKSSRKVFAPANPLPEGAQKVLRRLCRLVKYCGSVFYREPRGSEQDVFTRVVNLGRFTYSVDWAMTANFCILLFGTEGFREI